MSIDVRTRRYDEVRDLSLTEALDAVLAPAVELRADIAARGQRVMEVPPLGVNVGERGFTLDGEGGALRLSAGVDGAGVVADLGEPALSRLLQDVQSTMGLAMTSDVHISQGVLNDWIAWEPVLRALLDGRPVYEPGTIHLLNGDGTTLDTSHTFAPDDDLAAIGHFLSQAGFAHIRGVFEPGEMDTIAADLDRSLAAAQPDDGASWWAVDAAGTDLPVRVLWFDEHSEALAALLRDERLTRLTALTGDDHLAPRSAEGLVKPLDIVRGLSDLPWHKDCGQGHHSYMCNGMTIGISITGADRDSGALGVIAGSHRANTMSSMRDPRLDLESRKLETATGDVTIHCSDTLHRAYPPVTAPRKVVYTGLRLAPLAGDEAPLRPNAPTRKDRADLTSVTDRIEAADDGRTRVRTRSTRT
jgi:hypothetical protein